MYEVDANELLKLLSEKDEAEASRQKKALGAAAPAAPAVVVAGALAPGRAYWIRHQQERRSDQQLYRQYLEKTGVDKKMIERMVANELQLKKLPTSEAGESSQWSRNLARDRPRTLARFFEIFPQTQDLVTEPRDCSVLLRAIAKRLPPLGSATLVSRTLQEIDSEYFDGSLFQEQKLDLVESEPESKDGPGPHPRVEIQWNAETRRFRCRVYNTLTWPEPDYCITWTHMEAWIVHVQHQLVHALSQWGVKIPSQPSSRSAASHDLRFLLLAKMWFGHLSVVSFHSRQTSDPDEEDEVAPQLAEDDQKKSVKKESEAEVFLNPKLTKLELAHNRAVERAQVQLQQPYDAEDMDSLEPDLDLDLSHVDVDTIRTVAYIVCNELSLPPELQAASAVKWQLTDEKMSVSSGAAISIVFSSNKEKMDVTLRLASIRQLDLGSGSSIIDKVVYFIEHLLIHMLMLRVFGTEYIAFREDKASLPDSRPKLKSESFAQIQRAWEATHLLDFGHPFHLMHQLDVAFPIRIRMEQE